MEKIGKGWTIGLLRGLIKNMYQYLASMFAPKENSCTQTLLKKNLHEYPHPKKKISSA